MAPSITPIVIDNASQDNTLNQVRSRPGVRLIANQKNLGFATAVNQGIRSTDAETILLLNPDVELLTPLDALSAAARQNGLSAGKLLGQDSRAQAGFTIRRFPTAASLIYETLGINRLLPSNGVNKAYRYLDRDLDKAGPVDQPAGAFLMIRRDVWDMLGGLDERFFPIWFEDVDFCKRAADAGYRAQYVPSVQARHAGAHSIRQLSSGCRAWYWCVSLLRYAAKHFRSLGYRGLCAAVVLSSVPRMVSRMIWERSLAPIVEYFKIAWFAGLCLVSSRRRALVEAAPK